MTRRPKLPDYFKGYSKRSFICIKSGLTFIQAGVSKRKSKHDSSSGTALPTPSSDSDKRHRPKLHDQEVPEALKDRFHDFKVRYTHEFLDAAADKCYCGDIAMKLRYLTHNGGLSEACIVIEGRTKTSKRIRKLFVRDDVREFSRPYFRICLIDVEPIRLVLNELESIHVTGDFEGRDTLSGEALLSE
jgi:hypothetical protein